MAAIDAWLPAFDVGQRHQAFFPGAPEAALERALAMPAAPDRLIRTLFSLRGLAPDGSLEQFFDANGFTLLERSPTSYVIGLLACGRRLPLDGVGAWSRPAPPRSVKIAADFRAEAAGDGSWLITGTRVAAADSLALWGFRLYWLFIGPFSRLIRRRWLRAAVSEARPSRSKPDAGERG